MMKSKLRGNYDNVTYIELAGREVVLTIGDVQAEYEALRNGAMYYDCSTYGMIEISGNEAETFLENLSTKDIQYLNVGNASECYFLDEDAQVVGSVFVLRKEESFLVITPWEQADAVKEWIEKQTDGQEVSVKNMESTMALTEIEGPESWQVVRKVFDVEIENIALRAFETADWNGEEITLIRVGRSSEYGYMILSSFEKAKEIFLSYEKGKWDFPVTEGGFDALELAMLEVHQPNFLRETTNYGNIFELAQQWYIQPDKEDYIGYEKLMEKFEEGIKKTAVGFTCETEDKVDYDAKVFVGDDCIGCVVYAKKSSLLEKRLGIAILNKPYAVSGLTLEVETADGVRSTITTVSGPFIRPLSWDKKME